MLLILTAWTKLNFCQIKSTNEPEYPKVVVNEKGDTLCILSMENVDSINVKLLDLERYEKNSEIDSEIIDTLKSKSESLKLIILEKEKQLTAKDDIIENKDKIIQSKEGIIEEKDKKIKISNIKFGTSTGLVAVLAIVLLIVSI